MTTTLILVLNHSMIQARVSAHVKPILAKDAGTATVVVAQTRQALGALYEPRELGRPHECH
jgi:hypothetical protein